MEANAKTIAIIFTTLGVIFSMSFAFGLMPMKYGLFAAAVCFILAATARRILAVRR